MAAPLPRGADHTDGEDGSLLQDQSLLVFLRALDERSPARAAQASRREQGARRALLAAGGLLLLAALAGVAAAVARRPGAPADRTWSLHERKGFLLDEQGGAGGRQCAAQGGDCSKTKCCEDDALRCFSKHAYWATCTADCREGVHPSVNFDGEAWECKELSTPLDSMDGSEGDVAELEMVADEAQPSTTTTAFDYDDDDCRDTKPNDKCYKAVKWAMSEGIWQHPEWYEGLTPSSPFRDFQAKLHKTKYGDCPRPCIDEEKKAGEPKDKEAAAPEDEEPKVGEKEAAEPEDEEAATSPSAEAVVEEDEDEEAGEQEKEGEEKAERTAEGEEQKDQEVPRPALRLRRQRKRAKSPKAPLRSALRLQTAENPSADCSWAGDNCSQTRCCREQACTWDFETCKPLVCYKKDDSHASCLAECPDGWDCSELGASPRVLELPPATDTGKLHGDLIFCFSVVTPALPGLLAAGGEPQGDDAEGTGDVALSALQKKEGASVFACDGHAVLHGERHKAGSKGYKPMVESFIGHWKAIEKKGHYKKYDWVVKVDPDAVFFPHRLKSHLQKLKVQAGASVYIENSNFKYRFLSPLEVLSREAAELLFSRLDECAEHLGHQGGEDYFLKACLDAIGANHQSAPALLRDGYMDPYADDDCRDSEAAAFHPYKQVAAWRECQRHATEAGRHNASEAAA